MAKTKRLLIAGGGYAEIPLIRAAKRLGFYVVTSGNRPDELGHRESDEYRPGDFSDPEAMLRIAKDVGIDAICSCANDFSAISAAYVAERLGLPGHDSFATAKLLHHKDLFRAFAASHGLASLKAFGFSDEAAARRGIEGLTFPLIVKPVDLTGGKGISRIDAPSEAAAALEKAFAISRIKRVVVEEFVAGSRHGFSSIIRNGAVAFHFVDNESYYLNPYMVSAASAPSSVPAAAVRALIGKVENIASLLSLKDGIVHVQFILRDGEPVVIELCRRPPGDLYVKLVEHATGADYSAWIVRSMAGEGCSDVAQKDVEGFVTRHCVMADRPGVLRGVEIDPRVEGRIIDRLFWWKPGDRVENHLTAKFGIVFIRFDSAEEMRGQTNRLQELIKARVDPA